MALGVAAYIQFMKAVKKEDNKYFGITNGKEYPITDDKAAYYFDRQHLSDNELVVEVLANTAYWGQDLNSLPGFTEAVQEQLSDIVTNGALSAINNIQKSKILA